MSDKFYIIMFAILGILLIIITPHMRRYDIIGGFAIGLSVAIIVESRYYRRLSKQGSKK